MADFSVRNYIPGGVKSVQRGVATAAGSTTTSVTVNAVDTSKAFLIATEGAPYCFTTLYNSTTIRLINSNSASYTIYWQLVEFY